MGTTTERVGDEAPPDPRGGYIIKVDGDDELAVDIVRRYVPTDPSALQAYRFVAAVDTVFDGAVVATAIRKDGYKVRQVP